MGAQGSKGGQAEGTAQETAVDYYTLLEVSEDATQDEIRVGKLQRHELYLVSLSWIKIYSIPKKKSFRRLALIHHPDKA